MKEMTRAEIIDSIEDGFVLRKDFISNPGMGVFCHQFSVEILFTGVEYFAKFIPHGNDRGYLIQITKEQAVNFVNRHFSDN